MDLAKVGAPMCSLENTFTLLKIPEIGYLCFNSTKLLELRILKKKKRIMYYRLIHFQFAFELPARRHKPRISTGIHFVYITSVPTVVFILLP